jgi:RNA polymerase sigma-70 factor (ECF subfamily)
MKATQTASAEFIELIYDHQGILHRICSVYASSTEDREDLYQEIVLQSWRSYQTFQRHSKFSTWLYRVALNTALHRKRKDSSQVKAVSAEEACVNAAQREMSGEDVDLEMLYQCIQELPTLNRAIVLLYLEQHTYEEIAEITGLSRSNVSVRIVRIKDKLRQLLAAKGYCEV